MEGHALLRLGRYDDAVRSLREAVRASGDSAKGDEAEYLAGVSLVRLARAREALPYFLGISAGSPLHGKASKYATAIASGDTSYPSKRAGVAAALAVVPGAGYAYTQHYSTALTSLVVTGLLWWAGADAFKDGHEAAGATCSLFALGFHMGGIVGSAQSARRYNEYQWRTYQSRYPE
jgi:tetratricopeptide (TPR) repeat protein